MAQCPACHSANVQSLAMVYAAGTSVGTAQLRRRLGDDFARRPIVDSTNQTLLAKMAAPPTMPGHQKVALTVGGVIFLVIAAALFFLDKNGAYPPYWMFLIAAVVALLWSRTAFIANWDKDAVAVREQYAKTFLCHGCGHRFIPR